MVWLRRRRKRRRTRGERRRRAILIWTPIVVIAGICWPLATTIPDGGRAPADPVTISDYSADYRVGRDGEVGATETITTEFPADRHGIFRFWDRADPRDPGLRHETRIVSVSRDGHSEPYSEYTEGDGRYLVAKIGDPDVLLPPGRHVFVISYRTSGGIAAASAGPVPEFQSTSGSPDAPPARSVFWWDVIPTGWRMPIARATVTVHLPESVGLVQCSTSRQPTGGLADEGPCRIGPVDGGDFTVSATAIPAMGGMTVRAGLPSPPPPTRSVPWPWYLDPLLGTSGGDLLLVLAAALVAAFAGLALLFALRERKPAFPVRFSPPAGVGPVQAVFVCDEDVGDNDVAATIFHLGNAGLARVVTKSRSWTVTATDQLTPERLESIDPVGRATVDALGIAAPDLQFRASGGRAAGELLEHAHRDNQRACVAWSRHERLTRISVTGWLGRVVFVVGLVLTLIGFFGRVTPTAWSVVPIAFLVTSTLAGVWRKGATRRRSRAGREMWSRVGGFRRVLATPSSELRFDFAARHDLFLPYLPYAVAFGVAKEWAAKFELETDEDAPIPKWLSDESNRRRPAGVVTVTNSFSATVRSTIGAYQSGPSGSGGSGGSGGGSVGSGGGGGGGGSW